MVCRNSLNDPEDNSCSTPDVPNLEPCYNCGNRFCSGLSCSRTPSTSSKKAKDILKSKKNPKSVKSPAPKKESNNLLCEACALLEEHDLLPEASEELQAWYQAHESQEIDRLKKEALAKLSKREQRILGLT